MIKFKTTEIVIGQHPNKSLGTKFHLTDILLTIIMFPFRIVNLFNKGYTSLSDSDWELMFSTIEFKIEKRLVALTGFDNCIVFYNLSSTDKKLNEVIRGKVFGNFICKTDSGIFLRQFKSPKDWPNSKLVYIGFDNYKIMTVSKSDSSWVDWTCNSIADNQIDILTEHRPGYSKILRINQTQTN